MDLVIICGGALGREVWQYAHDVIEHGGDHAEFDRVVGFLDDDVKGVSENLQQANIEFDFVEPISKHNPRHEYCYILAAGNARTRHDIVTRMTGNITWANVLHPTAYQAPSARLGRGIIMAPFSCTGVESELGDHALLNTYASVGHDSKVGNYCVLSPYAVINGNVELGEEVFMGTHSTVIPGRKVGRRSSISAGGVVWRNINPGCLVSGNPATGRRMYDLE